MEFPNIGKYWEILGNIEYFQHFFNLSLRLILSIKINLKINFQIFQHTFLQQLCVCWTFYKYKNSFLKIIKIEFLIIYN